MCFTLYHDEINEDGASLEVIVSMTVYSIKVSMSQQNPIIACISIIGPDNKPLLIEKYCQENDELEIDTLLFCSLDYFEQINQPNRKPALKANERFLGNIQTSDRFQIWGYKAGLGYKIVILTSSQSSVQEVVMKSLCEKIKDILIDSFMDPFYQPFAMIESEAVIQKIGDVAKNITVSA